MKNKGIDVASRVGGAVADVLTDQQAADVIFEMLQKSGKISAVAGMEDK